MLWDHAGSRSNSLPLWSFDQCWPNGIVGLRLPWNSLMPSAQNCRKSWPTPIYWQCHSRPTCLIVMAFYSLPCSPLKCHQVPMILSLKKSVHHEKLSQSPAIPMRRESFLVPYFLVSKIKYNKVTSSQTWGLQGPHLGRISCLFHFSFYWRLCILFYALGP